MKTLFILPDGTVVDLQYIAWIGPIIAPPKLFKAPANSLRVDGEGPRFHIGMAGDATGSGPLTVLPSVEGSLADLQSERTELIKLWELASQKTVL